MKSGAAYTSKSESTSNGKAFAGHKDVGNFFSKERSTGNFFDQVQTKLTIGQAGDQYEVEADAMADKVVRRLQQPESQSQSPFFQSFQGNTALQTKCEACEDEVQTKEDPEGECAADVLQTRTFTHDASVICGDAADAIARPSSLKPTLSLVSKSPAILAKNAKEQEEVQSREDESSEELWLTTEVTKLDANNIQTRCTACEEEIQTKNRGEIPQANSNLEEQLARSKGRGNPMPNDTRITMENAFRADFSSVNIHSGGDANAMSNELHAQAFTHGSDIYFNQGKYNPTSAAGQHLLAHELTHTLQQGASMRRKPLEISSAPKMIQGFGVIDLIPDWIINNARQIPGYTLFTVIIEYDPLLDRRVERTAINLTEGLMGLVPFGTAIFDKLQEFGLIQRVFDWVGGQLSGLNLTTQGILNLLEEAWDELEFPYTNAIEVITRKFHTLVNRVRTFANSLVDQLITWIKEALINFAEPILAENRAWSLIRKIIHYDPLRDMAVEATTAEILEDFLLLIDKQTELEQMKERGTLQETADWLDTQVGTFMSLLGELRGLITSAWDAIQPSNLPNIVENIRALAGRATDFLERVWSFATTVAIEVLKLIKNALLSWLNSFAADIPGFTLLTVILARNPLTDEVVPRSVENIIRGFMGLVPGGESKFQELKQSGVIPRAAGQIEALLAELGFGWETIVKLFTDIWNSLSITDLIDPIGAFERIGAQFGQPISRLFNFVIKVVKVLVELILEIMGIPPDMVANIIANTMQAFEDIKNDPIGFLLNLMNAVKEGFLKFLNNIGTHLLNGLQKWLFGTLADAGIQIPSDISVRSILGLAMDILGITVDNILDRLALKIGAERVARIRAVLDTLSGIWAFVRDVIERGPIAIWEYIQGQISNLWNIIKDGIMGYIQEKVIQQAITWLLSFLDVTGIMPVIRGVQTVFNAITSFIEKLREILGIVNSFVAGVAEIARGSIQTAAGFLESALANGIPVAISFLAKQLGLGDISEKIQEMIENARGMINEGIDWLIDRAMAAGSAFLGMLGLGGATASEEEPISNLPTIPINEDVDTGKEMHQVKNVGETDRLMMHSDPTLLNEHPSAEVRSAYYTYITEIAESTNATAKREAANRNLRIIISKIREFGDLDSPGASAPGIGTIDFHKNQQSRMRRSGIAVWFTESEHVIPRAFINAAFESLAQAGIPAGGADYNNMHTILIYKGAANIKTNGPYGDQSTINNFKDTITELVQEVFGIRQMNPEGARSEMAAAVIRLLDAFASDAKTRTNYAIIVENQENRAARGAFGSPEPPTPLESQVATAFNRQKDDAQNQLQTRINQFLTTREAVNES